VNKRARNRLIGVTAIIIIAVAAIIYGTQMSGAGGSFARTPSQLAAETKLIGQRVSVTGPVVGGSWDKQTNPMKFTIQDEKAKPGSATIKVVYNGGVPTTFSDGTVAIVTGTLREGGLVEAQTLLTKCPSKYESATDALTVIRSGSPATSSRAATRRRAARCDSRSRARPRVRRRSP
jgi:cytochrome c-type biogenesis protein CcmE